MLYNSLVTLGEMSVTEVLVTEEATDYDREIYTKITSLQLHSYIATYSNYICKYVS